MLNVTVMHVFEYDVHCVQFRLDNVEPVQYLFVDVVIMTIPVERLYPLRLKLKVAFIEGLRTVPARRADRLACCRRLEDGGALACDDMG